MLLHWRYIAVLGEHVEQSGSKVKPDGFTVDFAHNAPVRDRRGRRKSSDWFNETVYWTIPVGARELSRPMAKALPGVKAFFGESMEDVVSCVRGVGDWFQSRILRGNAFRSHGSRLFQDRWRESVGRVSDD